MRVCVFELRSLPIAGEWVDGLTCDDEDMLGILGAFEPILQGTVRTLCVEHILSSKCR